MQPDNESKHISRQSDSQVVDGHDAINLLLQGDAHEALAARQLDALLARVALRACQTKHPQKSDMLACQTKHPRRQTCRRMTAAKHEQQAI